MTGAEVLDLGRQAIWLTVIISAPVMLVGLAVGFAVSLLQTLTQIQEQTLVFVPKIISIFQALLLFMPIMGGLLGKFMQDIFARIAGL
jgi:flagellar biosynthetic protein FliQ